MMNDPPRSTSIESEDINFFFNNFDTFFESERCAKWGKSEWRMLDTSWPKLVIK